MNIQRVALIVSVFLAGFLQLALPAAAASETPTHAPPDPWAALSRAQAYVEAEQTDAALTALDQAAHDVAAYADAMTPAVVQQPTETPRDSGPNVHTTATSAPAPTGACGGATNGADQYIARESGGDPNVYNAGGSGAWGCYQLMPEHFAPGGTCSDMTYGAATPAQQAECASRLPLSAWGG